MTKIFCTYRNWKSFYIKTDLILYNMKKNSIYLYTTFLELVDLTFYQIELGISRQIHLDYLMRYSTWCLFRVHKITTMSNHTYMTFKIFFFYIPNFVHQTQKQWDAKMDNKLKSRAQPEIVPFFYNYCTKR